MQQVRVSRARVYKQMSHVSATTYGPIGTCLYAVDYQTEVIHKKRASNSSNNVSHSLIFFALKEAF